MTSILCLAHYCDTHGPTPLMVTEGLSAGCSSCFEEGSFSTRRPSTSSRSINAGDGPCRVSGVRRTTSSASEVEEGARRAELQASGDRSSSAIETPPESPRVAHLQSPQLEHSPRRDSSFRRTYDENDKKRAIACENCALTLPKRTKEVSPSGNPRPSAKIDTSSPILRTKVPYERVAVHVDASPPKSPESSGELENADASTTKPELKSRRESQSAASGELTSSSNSSFGPTITHTHHIDFTSTHEPLSSTSFSLVRQSCLRTLSCETLPPNIISTTNSTIPSSPFINAFCQSPTSSQSSTSSSSIASTSGGPIFFGDPLAGYTTAYIFRIPDPNARGRRRVYALMALSTHHERLAMKSFSCLGAAFRELAAWIQGLAETELERSENVHSPRGDGGLGISGGTGSSGLSSGSFLSGRSRGPDGKFAGVSLRARGLAELVGLPDFFLELHARFVRLLVELNVLLGA